MTTCVFYSNRNDLKKLTKHGIINKEVVLMVKLVTKKASSEARQRADKIIRDVHKKLGKEYKFFCCPIGSQTRRCIVQDKNGKYDLDYQIVLTQNSKGDLDPTSIKKRFLWAFTSVRNKNEKVEDSTTVITVRCSKDGCKFNVETEKFSFDFVIINPDETCRIRRNGENQYTWVQLPTKHTEIYNRYKAMSFEQQKDLLENYLLPKIVKEKQKDESQRRATIDIFLEEVNNYLRRRERL